MTREEAQTKVDELRQAAEGLERQAAGEDTNATAAPQQQQGNHAQNAQRLRDLRKKTLADADEIERKHLRGGRGDDDRGSFGGYAPRPRPPGGDDTPPQG